MSSASSLSETPSSARGKSVRERRWDDGNEDVDIMMTTMLISAVRRERDACSVKEGVEVGERVMRKSEGRVKLVW